MFEGLKGQFPNLLAAPRILATGVCLTALIVPASPSSSDATASHQGVVVEEVTRGYAGDAGGVQVGDVILRWSREANPPANAQPAEGEIGTPFDLMEVETEQSPRGRLTLLGRRRNEAASWVLPQDEWRIRTRPLLSRALDGAYIEGQRLVRTQRVREGVARWRAVAAEGLTEQPWVAAWLSLREAEVFAEARDWASSDEKYASANRLLEQLGALGARGEVLREWSVSLNRQTRANDQVFARLDEAFECEQARNGASLATAKTAFLLGQSEYWRSKFPEAEAWYRRAFDLQQREAPGSDVLAETLDAWGSVFLRKTEQERARDYFEQARLIRETLNPRGVGFAKSQSQVAWGALFRSELPAAVEGFRRALSRLEALIPDSTETAFALTGLGMTRFRLGDFSGADEALRQAFELYERENPDSSSQGSVLFGLGQTAVARRDLEMAEIHYQRALAVITRSQPRSPELPIALHGLGDVALERKDYALAETYFHRSLAISESTAPESERTAWSLRCLARALLGKKDLDAAWEKARRSLELRERLQPDSYEVGASLTTVAEIAMERGDLETALDAYQKSLSIASRLVPGSILEAEALFGLGRVQRRLGLLESAAELFSRTVGTLEQLGARLGGGAETRTVFGAGYSRCYRAYLEVLLALSRRVEAFSVLERSRARALLAILAERAAVASADVPQDLVARQQANHATYDRLQAQLSHLQSKRDAPEIERLQRLLRELREEAAQTVARLREVSPRTASLHYPQPLNLDGALAALDPGTALLSYSVGEDDTSLFVVTHQATLGPLSVFHLPVGRKALQLRIERFRHSIEAPAEGSFADEAKGLYDLLIRPAEGLLSASARLVISPDGALHLLPFATLIRGRQPEGNRFLVEWKPVHVVASATVYSEIKRARDDRWSSAQGVLAAFGDPRFGPSLGPGDRGKDGALLRLRDRGVALLRLPSTREEVRGILAFFPSARTFLGEQATEENVKTIAGQVRYLHIASHAVLDEAIPMNSGLALSVPEKLAPGKDNGLLQAWEILDGLRIDADLVTLSACKTALGRDMGGEGLLGLTRAFQYAGARSVLASLWSVGDRSTSKLMRHFYGHLVAGKPKDESLRAAQIDMIRAGGPHAHPRHWAAFALFGDWQ